MNYCYIQQAFNLIILIHILIFINGGIHNQMQAFHEPPNHRPHCSSTQQWVTPELGLSSTPGQGIQTQAEVTGNSSIHNH